MKIISKYAAVALLTLTGVAVAVPANAIPALRITQGTNVVDVLDGGANENPFFSSISGVVGYFGNVGNYAVNVTGYTKPFIGTAEHPSIDFLSAQFSSSSATSTVVVEFSETDFTTSGPSISLPSLIGGTTKGALQYQTYASLDNALFEKDILISDSGILGQGAFSFSDYATIALQGDYSLTTVVTVTHGGSSSIVNSSFNATVEISEPALISLTTLSGLLFIAGFGARRRQRRQHQR
ncbi:MAG: hypothetical protein ACI9JL_001866 [Paracoccaceae bacterium]|jgi:hypothetical protein